MEHLCFADRGTDARAVVHEPVTDVAHGEDVVVLMPSILGYACSFFQARHCLVQSRLRVKLDSTGNHELEIAGVTYSLAMALNKESFDRDCGEI